MSLIAGLCNQTITSISSATVDGYGDETFTVKYNDVPCRWEEAIEQVVTAVGEVRTYIIVAYLLPGYSLEYNYEVLKDSEKYRILAFENKRGIDGKVDHIKVYLV